MRLYIVESLDGEWSIWRSTPLKERLHRVPRVKQGTITLDGKVYVVDPRRFRKLAYKPKRFLWLAKEFMDVQLWKENDPEPRDLFSVTTRDDDITGSVMATLSRSKRLDKLIAPQTDIMSMLLVLSIIGNIALAVVIYYVATSPTPVVNGGG